MAKKAVKKSKKKAPSRSLSASSYRHSDQNSFLLIVAGGFVVIVLVLISFGFVKNPTVRRVVQQNVNAITTKETVISIQNNMFTSPVTVKAGTKVTWINNDPYAHSIVADDKSFDLGTVTHGQSVSKVFDTPGTYHYHCSIHPGMEGTVIVE